MSVPKCTFLPARLAVAAISAFSATVSRSHARLSWSFFHSASRASLALGIFSARLIGIGVFTNANQSLPTNPGSDQCSWWDRSVACDFSPHGSNSFSAGSSSPGIGFLRILRWPLTSVPGCLRFPSATGNEFSC